MKVYFATSISQSYEKEYSQHIARQLEELGFEVYAAALNDSINDKRNNPRPLDIYNADVDELLTSDYLLVNITGSTQDGTISEVGLISGWNEAMKGKKHIPIIAYTTNNRLLNPQVDSWGIPSASANHLVLGMIYKWGVFVGNGLSMIKFMGDLKENQNVGNSI